MRPGHRCSLVLEFVEYASVLSPPPSSAVSNMQPCARTSGVLGALKDASLRSRRMAAGFARP
jgi:hypothetical protein